MDTEGANTTMFQSLYGLDEYLWSIDRDQDDGYTVKNGLDASLTKLDVGIHDQDFSSTLEGSDSLFDDEWMTTKIDFSSFDGGQFESTGSPVIGVKEAPLTDTMVTAAEIESFPGSNPSPASVASSADDSTLLVVEDGYSPNVELQELINMVMPLDNSVEKTVAQKMSKQERNLSSAAKHVKCKTRTPEQKERKKSQNRKAATRYRCKKRDAQDALSSQCSKLEEENEELRNKIESLQQETKYLKDLILDVFQKREERKTIL